MAVTADGTEVRPRRIGDRCVLGVKRGTGLARTEVECLIGVQEFDELWPATEGARLLKTRYSVPLSGVTAKVDVHRGALAGLRTVEVEFDTETLAQTFTVPDWFGDEITGSPSYKNQNLAVRGLPPAIVASAGARRPA
ncbi:hypothetical protein [Micromonospora sp. NPDC005206]|uniref:hypothetical protein n=1 Tax=Micromonospora sp. NPDC005206 TaxID=3157022 RepID=UPI0033BAFBC6